MMMTTWRGGDARTLCNPHPPVLVWPLVVAPKTIRMHNARKCRCKNDVRPPPPKCTLSSATGTSIVRLSGKRLLIWLRARQAKNQCTDICIMFTLNATGKQQHIPYCTHAQPAKCVLMGCQHVIRARNVLERAEFAPQGMLERIYIVLMFYWLCTLADLMHFNSVRLLFVHGRHGEINAFLCVQRYRYSQRQIGDVPSRLTESRERQLRASVLYRVKHIHFVAFRT